MLKSLHTCIDLLSAARFRGTATRLIMLVGVTASCLLAQNAFSQLSCSGHVTLTGQTNHSGVQMSFNVFDSWGRSVAGPPSVLTDSTGYFSQSGFPLGSYTYLTSPSKAGWTFTPVNRTGLSNLDFTGTPPVTQFSASGSVTLSGQSDHSGVTITFSRVSGTGAIPASVSTSTGGTWSQSSFESSTTYRATPTKGGWAFTPAYLDFSSATSSLSFSATATVSSPWNELGASGTGGGVSGTSSTSYSPVLMFDSSGYPVIAWSEAVTVSHNEIYLRRWNGSAWIELAGSASGGGISNNAGDSDSPSLVLNASGNPVVAWEDNTSGDYEIYVKQWNGSAWVQFGSSATSGGISNNINDSYEPSLVIDSSGYPVVAWMDGSAILMRRWDGSSWVEQGGSGTGAGIATGYDVSLRTDSNGIACLAWNTVPTGDIFLKKWTMTTFFPPSYSWSGLGGSDTAGGISNNSGTSSNPSLALQSDNHPVVAWQDTTNGPAEIYLKEWNGLTWGSLGGSGSAGGLSNTATASAWPSMQLNGAGYPVVAWEEWIGNDFTASEIYLRRWDGASWIEVGGSATGGGISGSPGQACAVSLALDNAGNPGVAWMDNRNGNSEIYFRTYAGGATGYSGSGTVTLFSQSDHSGATITFTRVSGTGVIPSSVSTNATGAWSQSGFETGTTYRATPTKTNWTFIPAYLDLSSVSSGLNFTGTPSSTETTIYSFPLDTNPGWTTEGQWAFGTPSGGGSNNYDPSSGHTGTNVYGYNLGGDYPNSMTTTNYLRTGALNCSGYTSVQLGFWRWLGVENSTYDHATVEVSNNGTAWTTVWQNGTTSIADTSWTYCTYDISSVADSQGTVFVRWSMGPTDTSVTYPGWNIDDVTLTGTPPGFAGSGTATLTGQSDHSAITVTFSQVSGTGALPSSVSTNSSGTWSQSGFESGTTYRATPSKTGWTFTPASLDFSSATSSLNFTGTTAVGDDYGNTPGTAAVVGADTDISGSNEVSADWDYFRVALVAGHRYEIHVSLGTLLDSTVALYAPDGTTQLAYNDDDPQGGLDSRIVYDCTSDGYYYVAERGFGSYTGTYTLRIADITASAFSASGTATLSGQSDHSGITITFSQVSGSGTLPSSVQTVSNGSWSQSGFESGTTYRATPSRSGWSFTPSSIDFSSATSAANFTASAASAIKEWQLYD